MGLARAADAGALILQYAYVTPELVAAAVDNGLLVYVWNIDDTKTLAPYLTMSLDRDRQQPPGGFDRISQK